MTARTPALRKKTARELADRFGVTTRTIRNHMAAPRDWWKEHRRALREKAAALRATGMKWADVGKALNVSESSARALGKRGAGAWSGTSAPSPPDRDPNTGDLFQAA